MGKKVWPQGQPSTEDYWQNSKRKQQKRKKEEPTAKIQHKRPKPSDGSHLHPSWQASKRRKAETISLDIFERTTFSDED
eukprot:m.300842 g.300842  ORF g.300842 m.300842 type:complete len:79 (+) comp40801_c0_seq19:2988-3224(+)